MKKIIDPMQNDHFEKRIGGEIDDEEQKDSFKEMKLQSDIVNHIFVEGKVDVSMKLILCYRENAFYKKSRFRILVTKKKSCTFEKSRDTSHSNDMRSDRRIKAVPKRHILEETDMNDVTTSS